VRTALANLFPDLRISRDDDVIEGETGSLERLKELIRNQRIRDTTRKQLLAARRGTLLRVSLSKQAAAVGRVNFSGGSPLGDIDVEIESDDLDGVIDDLAERTVATKR